MVIAAMLFLMLLASLGIIWAWKMSRRSFGGSSFANGFLALCVALQVFFAGLLGFEIYFRFFYDQTDSYGLLKTTDAWFQRHYQNNQMGVRDNIEYPVKKQPGRPRVVFLGDSFTAGHGVKNVEDRFVNLIRKKHPEWEIHAVAANGFDTGEEIKALGEAFQQGYEADFVVLVYCLNDISDIIPPWRENLSKVYENFSKTNFLIRESYALNYFYYRLQRSAAPEIKGYYDFVRNAYSGEIWEEQKKRLRLFRDVLTYRGVQFGVVTFPFLQDLEPHYSYKEVHKNLDAFWKDLEVPHLDLLSIYESHAPDRLVVNRFDAHPNEFAHYLAAEKIDEFLKKEFFNS